MANYKVPVMGGGKNWLKNAPKGGSRGRQQPIVAGGGMMQAGNVLKNVGGMVADMSDMVRNYEYRKATKELAGIQPIIKDKNGMPIVNPEWRDGVINASAHTDNPGKAAAIVTKLAGSLAKERLRLKAQKETKDSFTQNIESLENKGIVSYFDPNSKSLKRMNKEKFEKSDDLNKYRVANKADFDYFKSAAGTQSSAIRRGLQFEKVGIGQENKFVSDRNKLTKDFDDVIEKTSNIINNLEAENYVADATAIKATARVLGMEKGRISDYDVKMYAPLTSQKIAANVAAFMNNPKEQIPSEFRKVMTELAVKARDLAELQRAAKVGMAFNDYRGDFRNPKTKKRQLKKQFGDWDIAQEVLNGYKMLQRNPEHPKADELRNAIMKRQKAFFSKGAI